MEALSIAAVAGCGAKRAASTPKSSALEIVWWHPMTRFHCMRPSDFHWWKRKSSSSRVRGQETGVRPGVHVAKAAVRDQGAHLAICDMAPSVKTLGCHVTLPVPLGPTSEGRAVAGPNAKS